MVGNQGRDSRTSAPTEDQSATTERFAMQDGRRERSDGSNNPSHEGSHDAADATSLQRVLELRNEVRDLREQLTDLQVQLTTEVRTRRLVVEEGDGFARVVIDARDFFGGVEVRARSHPEQPTSSGLFALDPIDAEPAQVGAFLSDGGNIEGSFDLYSGRRPRVWLGRHENGS